MGYFDHIPNIKYEGASSQNPFAFHYYDADALIAGKPMREQLKFAMSYWHTLCADGTDMFGVGTQDKFFGATDPMEISRRRAEAGFELMEKLDIDYFCFHDRDIAPEGNSISEFHKNLDITIRLGGTGCVFWGGREGYETLLNTNMALEQDNMARLLSMAADYAYSKGFQGDLYIEPKPKEPTKHQYDFDAAAVIGFLRKYGLEKQFKLNIEANHATLAGHTFAHELCTARINGMFGSIDANQGDMLLGWDTDQFPTNVYDAALCMLEVLRAGGFTNGGLNFDAKTRRGSFTHDDIFLAYIAGMDTFALGLKIADRIIKDGRLDRFVSERYSSWSNGIGADIIAGKVKLEDLCDYAYRLGEVTSIASGGQERLEALLQQLMFGAQ